ncbi:MAG: Gfo/Idh/MocA family protein [Armatimonadota bacterium]|jgi:predicted dehydrogenase
MTRIGLLGAGSHSYANHGAALKYLRDRSPDALHLAAVCDLDGEKARRYARDFGFEAACTDIDRMLTDHDIDGLILITPVELTEELATRLLPLGIPLVIEKPPGVDSDAVRRLVHAARETSTPHMVSMNRRFSPALVRARQWLDANAATRPPRVCIARMLRHNRTEPSFRVWTGIHLVDAALSIMGRPCCVHAANTPAVHEEVFYSRAEVETELGAVHYFLSPAVGVCEETYEFHGPDYTVLVDAWNCALTVFDSNERVLHWRVDATEPPAYENGTVGETQAFIDAIEGRRDFGPTLEDALMSVLTAEAIAAGGDTTIAG